MAETNEGFKQTEIQILYFLRCIVQQITYDIKLTKVLLTAGVEEDDDSADEVSFGLSAVGFGFVWIKQCTFSIIALTRYLPGLLRRINISRKKIH